MPYNFIERHLGLFQFLRRFGAFIEIIIEAGGFTTETPGAVNVLYQWKNVKGKNRTKRFKINVLTPLIVNSTKHLTKSTRLNILIDLELKKNYLCNVLTNILSKGFTRFIVNKHCLPTVKSRKLKILLENSGQSINSLTLSTSLETDNHTPLNVLTWLKRKFETKLGVFIPLNTDHSIQLEERLYMIDDVGTISDIEMIEMIQNC